LTSVAPADFSTFNLGALLDFRVLLIEPSLHGLRTLFIGPPDWLLGCESPTGMLFTDATNRKLDAKFAFDQLHDGSPIPQSKAHLQLLWPLVTDDLPY